jgi:hypothetical protein
MKQGINQCKGSKAIIKELTNYVVEVEYKEAYLIFLLAPFVVVFLAIKSLIFCYKCKL